MVGYQLLDCLGRLCLSILDDVAFIKNTVIPFDGTKEMYIFPNNVIRCDNQIVIFDSAPKPNKTVKLNLKKHTQELKTHFSLSLGGPTYCNGFKYLLDKNLATSSTQCPVSVGGQMTKDGSGALSGDFVFLYFSALV
jgi:hypothetical protein